MAAATATRLRLWKAVAAFAVGLAALAFMRRSREGNYDPVRAKRDSGVAALVSWGRSKGSISPAAPSAPARLRPATPLRQSDQPIVIDIDDLDLDEAEDTVQEWVRVAPVDYPDEEFPVPQFINRHHHH